MGGAFSRNARTIAVEGQQTAYVNLWVDGVDRAVENWAQLSLLRTSCRLRYEEHITRGSRAAIWQLGPRDLGSEGKRYAGFLVCLRIRGPHFVAMIRLPRNAGMAKRSPGARTLV